MKVVKLDHLPMLHSCCKALHQLSSQRFRASLVGGRSGQRCQLHTAPRRCSGAHCRRQTPTAARGWQDAWKTRRQTPAAGWLARRGGRAPQFLGRVPSSASVGSGDAMDQIV
mmetsp:Transcript_14231/g.42370  ORF Transcript_14231/g.42370 Transcript_14231/m.42370 type:complete len:112 (-) Transcript_14231:20-355(-)